MIIINVLYVIAALATSYLSGENNLLLKLVSFDSLVGAIYFIMTFVNKNLSESQILKQSNLLYNEEAIDRYIYYVTAYVCHIVLRIFFWVSGPLPHYVAIIISIPCIMNHITKLPLFKTMIKAKEYFIKSVISQIILSIIKFYTKLYLHQDIKIKGREIMILLNNYTETIEHFVNIGKNFLLINILSYFRNLSPVIYYGFIKYIYNYKSNEILISYNNEDAKQYLQTIIQNRKWHEFTKLNSYKAMLCLYQINDNGPNFIKASINEFNFCIIKMFSIWTISSFFNNIYLPHIISLLMTLYKRQINANFIFIFVSLLLTTVTNNYLLLSFICQFGYQLTCNKITTIIYRIISKFIRKKLLKIISRNRTLISSYVITVIYTLILNYYDIVNNFLLISLNIISNILLNIEPKKQIIFTVIICTTSLSNYNILHVFFNTLVLYCFAGFDYECNILDLIHSYFDRIKPTCGVHTQIIKTNSGDNIDQNIFNLSDNDFINAISIDDIAIQKKVTEFQIIDQYLE